MKILRFPKSRHAASRGFTITELAIVFGIIGVILAGIWVAIGNVQQNANREKLAEELSTIVNNIHSLYAGQANVCGNFDQLTAQLLTENAIPSTMVGPIAPACTNPSGVCVEGPWGATVTNGSLAVGAGNYTVASAGSSVFATPCTTANAQQQFTIEIRGLTAGNCSNLAPQISASGGPPGLQDVVINGTDILTSGTTTHSLPVQVHDATSLCTAGSTVDFIYRLQMPAF